MVVTSAVEGDLSAATNIRRESAEFPIIQLIRKLSAIAESLSQPPYLLLQLADFLFRLLLAARFVLSVFRLLLSRGHD